MAKKKHKTTKPKPPLRPWRITWRGSSWTEDDLTGQHLATLAIIAGDDAFDLLRLTPVEAREYPRRGFMRLMYMVSALAVTEATDGLDDEDAQRVLVETLSEIQKAPAEEIVAALSFL